MESAKCGHVKRRLKRNEPLTGKVLEFALSVLGEEPGVIGEKRKPSGDKHTDLLNGIADKLRAGQQLDEYEYHVFVEVILLHVRLSGGTPINSKTFKAEKGTRPFIG